MEELLNKLIEKGWKPFGEKSKFVEYLYEGDKFYFKNIPGGMVGAFYCGIRELVSKESGLWQFVCENGMVKPIGSEIAITNLNEGYGIVRDTDYQYRLIESALRDESELEDFLLQNIKVGNED